MNKVNRRMVLLGGASAAALAVVGCGGGGGGDAGTSPAPAPTPTPTPSPSPTPLPTPTPSATPAAVWACVGDSMTHGVVGVPGSIPTFLSQRTGIPFDDLGVIAQTSTEITARMGAIATVLSVDGDTIPASGAVALAALSPKIVNHTGPDAVVAGQTIQLAILGSVGDVAGYLSRKVDGGRVNDDIPIGDFSFTRLTDGVATPCPAGSRFVPDNDAIYHAAPMILRMGYNNRADFDAVVADHLAMFAWSTVDRARVLLLDPPISYYDDAVAKAQSNRIAAWLRDQASARGMIFFSVQGYVASQQGLTDAGVTPSSDDLAAIAERRTPMSATVGDGLHYTAAMNQAVAARLAAVLHDAGAI